MDRHEPILVWTIDAFEGSWGAPLQALGTREEASRPSWGGVGELVEPRKVLGRGQGGSRTDPEAEGLLDFSGKVQSALWSAKGGLLVAPDGAWAGLGCSKGCCRVLRDAPGVQYEDL